MQAHEDVPQQPAEPGAEGSKVHPDLLIDTDGVEPGEPVGGGAEAEPISLTEGIERVEASDQPLTLKQRAKLKIGKLVAAGIDDPETERSRRIIQDLEAQGAAPSAVAAAKRGLGIK
jgi:hypothetical protein